MDYRCLSNDSLKVVSDHSKPPVESTEAFTVTALSGVSWD